jgi:hypothetical protein
LFHTLFCFALQPQTLGIGHIVDDEDLLQGRKVHGWLDHDKTMMEAMLCFKRAGADGVLTYFARDIARLVKGA